MTRSRRLVLSSSDSSSTEEESDEEPIASKTDKEVNNPPVPGSSWRMCKATEKQQYAGILFVVSLSFIRHY